VKITDEAKARRRAKVDSLAKQGLSERQIAKRLQISRTLVWNVKQEIAAEHVAAMKRKRGTKK
jgi:transposase